MTFYHTQDVGLATQSSASVALLGLGYHHDHQDRLSGSPLLLLPGLRISAGLQDNIHLCRQAMEAYRNRVECFPTLRAKSQGPEPFPP